MTHHIIGYHGRGEPGATVKVHVHGVVIRDVGVDGAGNWSTHIGRQDPNRRIEAQQRYVGRPWSGWSRMVVQQLPQMPPPSINYIDSSHYWVSRKRRTRSNSKTTCSWCCYKRCWSRWSRKLVITYRKTITKQKNRSTTIQTSEDHGQVGLEQML